MRIYWRALIGYGFIFWIVLCVTDFLGFTSVHQYSKDLDELYDKPVAIKQIESKLEPHLNKIQYEGLKFGWSLLIWNALTFTFSVIICSIARTIAWMSWSFYKLYRNRSTCLQSNLPNQYATKSTNSLSRIPVIVKPTGRSSETNLPTVGERKHVDMDKSCPNLLTRGSGSNLSVLTNETSKTCRTLFRKDIYLRDTMEFSHEEQLEKQCRKLKEELHRVQTTSLKEHAILSRKLDSVNKDKRELTKQLNIAQKENRAAKQQLEELLEEKTSLLKKLENATKEFKCNTKTKKYALAKLEEVTNNVEELRQQLEQVSRDKEILEKKLKLLEVEYNKLHERYITSQQKMFTNNNCNNENLPERDENNQKDKHEYLERCSFAEFDNSVPPAIQQTAEVLASVSQTELDMRKIQEKIKQLEKNLETLNIHDDLGYTRSLEQFESEVSLSALENTTDSQHRMDDESATNFSEFSSGNSPRQKYWSEKVTDLIGKNKHQFAKIQELAYKMQEKALFLGNIREKIGSTEEMETTDSDDVEPKRLVSSSLAFKNFLKSLNKLDAAKKDFPSKPEVYF